MNLWAFLSLLGFLFLLFSGIIVFSLNPRIKTNRLFMLVCLSFAYWSFAEYGYRQADTYDSALFWINASKFWPLSLAILLHFAMVFTEKTRLLRNWFAYAAIYSPALVLIAIDLSTGLISGTPVKDRWGWTNPVPGNTLFVLSIVWSCVMAAATVILSTRYFFTAKSLLKKKQAKYVSLGLSIPIITGLTGLFFHLNTGFHVPDFTTSTFVLTSVVIGFGIWKYRLFSLTPATAAENIISTMSDALLIVNNEDRIITANTAACNILGYSAAELAKKPVNSIFADVAAASQLQDITWFGTMMSAGSIGDIQSLFVTKSGATVPISLSASTLKDASGQIVGMVFICRDITERKHGQEALKAAHDELEHKVAQRTADLERLNEQLKIELTNSTLAEEEMRNSERRYRAIVDDHTELICRFLADTTLTFVNGAFCRYFGRTQEALVGTRLAGIIVEDDRTRLLDHIASCAAARNASPVECRVHADAGVRWQQLIIRPLYDKGGGLIEFQAVGIDVTDRTAAQEALAAEKERLMVTLRSIGDGVATTDTGGTIVLLNSVAEHLTGFTQREAEGRRIDDCLYIVNERSHSRLENPVSSVLVKKEIVTHDDDLLLVARDGTRRTISLAGAPIRDSHDRIVGAVLVFRDITERRTLESELFKARKLESMGVLAGGIASDFSTLLSEIITHLFTAKIHLKAGDDAYRHISDAEAAAFRASRLTKQLLTFSKGDATVKERTSIKSLIEDSVGFCLSGSRATYRLELPDDLSVVEVDRGQIDQAISNIVINADQAMPDGGTIFIAAHTLSLSPEAVALPSHIVRASRLEPGNYVCISIRDEGVGIPPENLDKIFDPYFTTKPGSNGLGLTTAYSIIKKHNGYISVSSEPGAGATFCVYIPAVKEKPDNKGRRKSDSRKKTRLLLLAEEVKERQAFSDIVNTFGCSVDFVSEWDEAFLCYKIVLGSADSFAAVIISCGSDYADFLRERLDALRALDPSCRVIIAAEAGVPTDVEALRRLGSVGVITKPFSLEEISVVLQAAIKEKAGAYK
jgi:two-component system, cell cycle sensor histidine kinase and response regulator CckA